jgi:FkbM family methyltransferase
VTITARRKRRFCHDVLAEADAEIGFADVGSGGPLKLPWSVLPPQRLRAFPFEPTGGHDRRLPLCVSNRSGRASFHVARDERASSFHRALGEFAERFGMSSLHSQRTIEVECVTLDDYFEGKVAALDALDVNVEGHDFQVLQGAPKLLRDADLKLVKVEFEVAAVWEGQGWFGDIDSLMRGYGYDVVGIDVEFARPVSSQHCFHRGEPLWGKALYAPSRARWRAMLERRRAAGDANQAVAKAVALYVAADLPGRAFDVLELDSAHAPLKERIAAVYRWARLDHGAAALTDLIARSTGLKRVFA